ncbi:MAG: FAD-dependent oxidoreductase [Planctomycetota bacterium]
MSLTQYPPSDERTLRETHLDADLTIVGGGLAGTCCAITAARQGLKVTLIQDRPVLGGNASSEVRLWVLGATSHGNNNNRWAREGGVVDEFLCENFWRNPEGNPLIVDTILLEMVTNEPNITLLLNTAVFEAEKSSDDPDRITGVVAFCSQNSTMYRAHSPLFVDASGDGILGFLAGAAFRIGAEAADEFGESLAPDAEYGGLLGHSIYFYSKDVGRPVRYTAPSFALDDITQVPRYRRFNAATHGCRLWWIEYGGRLDTVHDTEAIKWELWKVVYGVWDHIKNSGEFPEADTMTLEWVGTVPGKRESRRFEGDYMLSQRDLAEQRRHEDAVAFGGWAVDLHPADGVYSDKPGCSQFHVRGVYQIPYRCLYSRNIPNLFLAGRIISVSHVAFGSTRVMATCAHAAQAVAMAAGVCLERRIQPRDIARGDPLMDLQRRLLRSAQHIPHLPLDRDDDDLAKKATVDVSSTYSLDGFPVSSDAEDCVPLDRPRAMLVHLPAGPVPRVSFELDTASSADCESLVAELRTSERTGSFAADRVLARQRVSVVSACEAAVAVGGPTATVDPDERRQAVGSVDFGVTLDGPRAVYVCLDQTPGLRVRQSDRRVTGVMSVSRWSTANVSADNRHPGLEDVDLWPPTRRPAGKNLACAFDPPVRSYGTTQLMSGYFRPGDETNAWVADLDDPQPSVTLRWTHPIQLGRIDLHFDADIDHPMESVLLGHPERVSPYCVSRFRISAKDADGRVKTLADEINNRHSHRAVLCSGPIQVRSLCVSLEHPSSQVPASLLGIRCYSDPSAGPVPPSP